jgi:hypothetical protein
MGRHGLAPILLILALGLSGLWATRDYFVVYAEATEPSAVFGMPAVEKAELLRALAEARTVYPSRLVEQRAVIEYLTSGAGLIPLDLSEGLVVPAIGPAWYAFAADEEADSAAAFGARWPSLPRETVTNGDGVPRWLLFGSENMPPPASSTSATLDDGSMLVGETLSPPEVAAGTTTELTLSWRAAGPMAQDYTVFVHVVGYDGRAVAQHDKQPLGGSYPTSRWRQGDLIVDRFMLSIAPDAAPGEYTVLVGWYDLATGSRLPLFGESGELLPNAAVPLGTRLSVTSADRQGSALRAADVVSRGG